jgi:FkbM family methyltransferase
MSIISNKVSRIILPTLPPIVLAAARWLLKEIRTSRAVSDTAVRLKYGEFFLECDSSHHLPHILASLPDFGRNLADIVRALEVPEPYVIDVGANIGDTALLLARFAPGAKMLCIEGDPRFMSNLKSNTSQIGGVTIAQAVLSDRSAQVRGTFRENLGTAHLVVEEGGDLLNTQTLDDLLRDYPQFSRPHLIKVDTDGFDPAILRGSKEVLASSRPVVFYEWDPYSYRVAGENDVSHADFLMDLGYDWFLIFTNRGQLLLYVRRPGHKICESLAHFSRSRRSVDGWHYDVAAFPSERQDVCERIWRHYLKSGANPNGIGLNRVR